MGTSHGLSAVTITRLTRDWQDEAAAFNQRSLADADYVYVWVDGIHLKVRLAQDKVCLLVMIGVRADGAKELIALHDGHRESTESWADLLRSVKRRGMAAPVLAVGDGALGFWAAIREAFPQTREQRCWFHKIANVLNALPKSAQPGAKAAIAEIWNAEDREHAAAAAHAFATDYGAKWPKAVAKITDDLDELLAFYDYPAEHWIHLRTTNPVESTFATVRLRQRVTKGPGSRAAGVAMAFKLIESAQARWRRSTRHIWSPLSAPTRSPSEANSSSDPTDQEVISKSPDTPIHRSPMSSTGTPSQSQPNEPTEKDNPMTELNAEHARRAIVEHTRRLAESAAATGPDAAVPTTPEWTITDLVEHVSQTQHWVAEIIERRITDPTQLPTEMAVLPTDPREWQAWLSESAQRVASACSDDALDAPVFNAAGDERPGTRFWMSSVLNEAVVHGFDAANAADRPADIDADIAAALISNHLAMLTSPTWEMQRSESAHAIGGTGQTLQWLATDTADEAGAWFVERQPDGATWQPGTQQADVTVTGPARSLLLTLTRRLPLTAREATNISVDGDTDLAQHWLDNTAHASD